MQNSFQTSDGIRIAYHVDGFTPPWQPCDAIILLHSMMGESDRFFAWMPALSARFRVLRMDLRGHGASQVPGADAPLTLERLVDDVAELLDHVGIDTLHVVGNSAGGYVAQKLAITMPQRVRSLMLFGSTPGLKSSGTTAWIPKIRAQGLREFLAATITDRFPLERCDPGLVAWFLDRTGSCDAEFICRWLALTNSLDWSDELDRIACPTLIVRPGGETVGSVSNYDVMRERIPDSELLTYVGFPHNICDIVPGRCVADVLAFIERRFP
jgi:pimeloyl-ACP methyl ester carboxylesterase